MAQSDSHASGGSAGWPWQSACNRRHLQASQRERVYHTTQGEASRRLCPRYEQGLAKGTEPELHIMRTVWSNDC